MMSFGNGPKIYLRGAKPSILKYGVLGHRPLSFERLVLTHVCHSRVSFVLTVMHSRLALHMFSPFLECLCPYQCDFLNPSLSYPSTKLIYSAQESSTLYMALYCGGHGTTG